MNRAVAVARMHLVDRMTLFVMPLGILAAAFVANLLIWLAVPVDGRTTGALTSVYCFVLAAAVLAVLKGLPFALSLGSSRRAFTIGTIGTGGVIALIMGVILFVLGRIEVATDGWGMHGHFFDLPWFESSPLVVVWLGLTVGLLAAFVVGILCASVWSRWGNRTLLYGAPVAILVGGGLGALVTWQHWWGHVLGWLDGQTLIETTGWLALLTVACGGLTYATLRRIRA